MTASHQHGHHHADSEDLDWEALGPQLERQAELHLPFIERATGWLAEQLTGTDVTRVFDLGSGPGVVCGVLARTFPRAQIVAVDGAAGLLERVRVRAAERGLADRIVTRRADLPDGLDGLGAADLIWTSKVVHHLGDQQASLRTLAASLRPGGLLAVAEGGLGTRCLPRDCGLGRPGLEARLEAAEEDWFAGMRAALPGHTRVVEDWPALLTGAGLVTTGTRSFLTDLPAPLGADARAYLHDRLARLRELLAGDLDPEDLRTLDALLDTEASQGILRRPDAFLLTATTVHTARSAPPTF
ncbi:methyltransferase domain-containing protein [Streptomyces sp. A3M-1-3]|uniref:methyltransferase n=1 Tax=Streptomyces sp. A3M-1-3 TaxID=2962044 RepID=UPI0020B7C747|nr:class I SAM-dependent methyltransferase [Streptomyces sp. A3M-1-3]MCP3820647.1 methyltransferase domain-containing protein [Streptomyces sp. A3M-1-3]